MPIGAPLEALSDWVLVHLYEMHDVEWLGRYGERNVHDTFNPGVQPA